jgi:hypothetical protein
MGRLLVFFVLSSVAAAGTIEDGIPDTRYRAYGESFAPYTRPIMGVDRDGRTPHGSCVLIAPHWAVTAAHVTDGMVACSIKTPAGEHVVTKFVPHPDYGGEFGWHYISLVHVATPFTLAKYPALSDGTERLGSVAAAAGYGMTGRLSTGITGDGGSVIRAGTMRLVAEERSVLVCQIARYNTPLPYCIAPGDSGGGLFATAADGTTRLVGINSCVTRKGTTRPRHVAGEESCHTKLSLYVEWIRRVAGLDGRCLLAECQQSR